MKSSEIPESLINKEVATVVGHTPFLSGTNWYIGSEEYEAELFDPLNDHDQFHALMTPEIMPKVCDVLHVWFSFIPSDIKGFNDLIHWWRHPDYLSNSRLWDLRAYVEVMRNEQ